MPEPLLQTKLYIPPPRPNLVSRPRLLEQLNRGLESGRKLSLVSTPPGFGKTTLLSQWIATLDRPVGWVSLDEDDNDQDRFLSYLIAALQQIEPGVGEALLPLPYSPQSPLRTLLAELIAELSEIPERVILVLDDFHVIANQHIHDALVFAVQHLPPQMRLILSSRTDPPWPLARLRAQRDIVELRTGDLRFTAEEAAAFLNDVMATGLSAADVATLDTRTEGWVTGLQLAALSMRGKEELTAFVNAFSGSNRFILDYLMEEVIERQPVDLQDFLFKTAILARLNGPLCDAVLEQNGSQAILTQLEHDNVFLVSLDDERYWFRYHHLFANLLQKRLAQSFADQLLSLHRRASDWFEEAGLVDEAIHHAVAGQDLERAASLVAGHASESMRNVRISAMAKWLDALPQELISQRPWLAVCQAFVLEFFRRADVEQSLQWAENALARDLSTAENPAARYSASERHHISGIIAAIRAHNALAFADIPRSVAQASKALTLLPEEDTLRLETTLVLGCADWARGDRAAAEKAFEASLAVSRKLGHRYYMVASMTYLGSQIAKQGRLLEAYETYAKALAQAERLNGRTMPIGGFPMNKMADLQREWNDLDQAASLMDKGLELAIRFGQADALCEAYALLARMRLALADEDDAQEAIEQAEQILHGNPVDLFITGWLNESQVRIWLSRGELEKARRWAEDNGLTVDSELSYHHDLHHISLARVLIAQGADAPSGSYLADANRLLDRLLTAAEKADWVHETIKILVLQAVLGWTRGDPMAGAAALERALVLAEPGGYVRLFLDEGEPVHRLLQTVVASTRSDYAGRLLAKMKADQLTATGRRSTLPDPLSQRESEVLRLLETQLSNTQIAAQLVISPNTVRFHMKNIYDKLDVHSRSEAVEKARTLNLI